MPSYRVNLLLALSGVEGAATDYRVTVLPKLLTKHRIQPSALRRHRRYGSPLCGPMLSTSSIPQSPSISVCFLLFY